MAMAPRKPWPLWSGSSRTSSERNDSTVVPAKAGIHADSMAGAVAAWTPAFAGVTVHEYAASHHRLLQPARQAGPRASRQEKPARERAVHGGGPAHPHRGARGGAAADDSV